MTKLPTESSIPKRNQTFSGPQIWLIINIILTTLAFIALTLAILVKFTNISHASQIFTISSIIINIFLESFAFIASLISPGIVIIAILVILIMNPVCALDYLVENRREKLTYAIKNRIFATLPLILNVLMIVILSVS